MSDGAPSLGASALAGGLIGSAVAAWDASRFLTRRDWIAGETYAAWVLLMASLALTGLVLAAAHSRPELLIALVFAVAFFAASAGLRFMGKGRRKPGARVLRSAKEQREQFEKSFTGDPAWASGVMQEDDKTNPIPLWPIIMFCGLGVPTMIGGFFGDWFMIPFGAAATAMGGWVWFNRWRGAARLRKYGVCTFKLGAAPLSLKDGIYGELTIPKPPPVERLQAKLQCIRYWTETISSRSPGGKSYESQKSETMFEATLAAELMKDGRAEVYFYPPASLPPARAGGKNSLHWRLSFYAPDPKLSFGATFRLPVGR